MRNLALILLLANLALLGWQHWLREPPAVQPRVLPDVPLLQAARGVPPPVAPEVEGRAVPSGTQTGRASALADAPQCVALGPFSDPDVAAAATEGLRSQLGDAQQRAADGRVWTDYWVRLEHPTREAANASVQRLHDAGLGDAYLIPGEEVYLVSLGLFRTRPRADRLLDDVRALGEEPLVVDRFRDGTVYWVDLMLPAGEVPDLAALPVVEGPAPALQPAACPPAASTD